MKSTLITATLIGASSAFISAGQPVIESAPAIDGFSNAINPISNPTLSDLALPQTNVHAMLIHQKLPSQVNLGGAGVDLGGDLNLVAIQLEYALNERLSIVATKDGYIDFNPENTLTDQEGFANLAAGLKYAFIYDPASQFALAGSAIVELPTGNRDVFQGYGDGAVNLQVHALKLLDKWQFSGSAGVHLPLDGDAESLTGFASGHISYRLTERFIPLAEINLYHTFSDGDGSETPISVTDFEGGDLINLGSSNAYENRDAVTAALGFRYILSDSVNLGAAYEIPLTDESDGLMDSRVTIDIVWKF